MSDPDRAYFLFPGRPGLLQRLLRLLLQAEGLFADHLPGRCQCKPLLAPMKQREAKMRLQIVDLLHHRIRGDIVFLGRLGKAAQLRYLEKQFQIMIEHTFLL